MTNAASPPRWKVLLDKALEKNPGATVFQLATLQPPSSPSTTPGHAYTHPQPRVRSHVFRSFVDALPPGVRLPQFTHTTPTHTTTSSASHSSSSEGGSEPGAALPLLISTTDIRTPKVSQILSSPFVEIAWWIDGGGGWDGGEGTTKQQFRIAGAVRLVPSPRWVEPSGGGDESGARGEKGDESEENQNWWETQRTQSFSSMSAHMKASWARPTPGSPLSLHGGHDAPHSWPTTVEAPSPGDSQEERDRKQGLWDKALGNFALVVIEPQEVDFVDLGVVPNRRWRFWRDGGVWREEEVVA